jgi:hypothetical protein
MFGLPFHMPKVQNKVKDATNPDVYAGTYLAESGMKVTIIIHNKSVYAQLAGKPPFEIYAKGNHQLFGKKVEIEFSFNMENGKAAGVIAERMGQKIHFKKAP